MADRKIVFLDVDGTLINYEGKMPESAGKAVEKARAAGHLVYICTGCSKAEIEQKNWTLEFDGMIGGNGAYVEDRGRVVMQQSLTEQQCSRIAEWCTARNIGFYLESNSGMYMNDLMAQQGPRTVALYAKGKGADPASADAAASAFLGGMILTRDFSRNDVNKISFILRTYQDHLDSKRDFPDLEANTWGGRGELALFGDLGPRGITKKHAVEVLLKHLNASAADTVSFGDAKIDLSMFECCAFNVAMGNGGPEIKEAADYITDDVDEDGLYHAFEYLGLI